MPRSLVATPPRPPPSRYLNLGGYATEDWQQYYAVDPHDFQGTTEQVSWRLRL